MAARKETKQWGLKPYTNRIQEAQSLGIEYLYLCGWGTDNIQFIGTIARDQKEAGRISIISSDIYNQPVGSDNDFPSICVTCAVNLRISPKEALSSTDILRNLLEEHVVKQPLPKTKRTLMQEKMINLAITFGLISERKKFNLQDLIKYLAPVFPELSWEEIAGNIFELVEKGLLIPAIEIE